MALPQIPNTPSFLENIKNQITTKTLESSGFINGVNAANNATAQIARIAGESQSFIERSLMGRGLTIQKFSAAKPGKKWSQLFPYRFLVTNVNAEGKHSIVAEFRLPISPQQLTVSTPYAIKTTVTSRGILEEHNGMPIRRISMNGTTGIYMERSSGGVQQKRSGIIGTLFGGTFDAANSAVNSFKQAAPGVDQAGNGPLNSNAEEPDLTRTGYYQFHILQLFINTYVETKKTAGSQNLRLIFEMAKDNVSYIVTPVNFDYTRAVQSPMEYIYKIDLLAWATVPDFRGAPPIEIKTQLTQDIGDLRRALNLLKNARKVVTQFKNIVSAVRADIESNILGPVNDMILLTKDLLGIPIAIADLPKSLRDSFQTTIVASWDSLSATNEELKSKFNGKFQAMKNESSGSPSYLGAPKSQTGDDAATATYKSDVLDDLSLTDAVQLDQLQPTQNQQLAVNAAQEAANNITTNDIKKLIGELGSLSTALEAQIEEKNALDDEWDLLYNLGDSISELYGYISNGNMNRSQTEKNQGETNAFLATNAMTFWDQTTTDNNIPFIKPLSKYSIPFPLGSTLEQISSTYLGDASRWPEIVAINGLQYPYVDEQGFAYPLIGNGSVNQLNVTSDVNLFVDQDVYISSNTQLSTKRKIQAISKVSDTNFLLIVDGPANLSIYTTQDNAQILAFLPYTVNSMKQIAIPVDSLSSLEELDTPPITFLNADEDLIKFAHIDWLLDAYGDYAVTKDGFMNLAFGNTNLMQAAKSKMTTLPGAVPLYPSYGAGVEPGESFADLNLDQHAQRIDQSFRDDPRFNSPSSIQLNAEPTVLKIDIVASISKDDGILPISLPLTKQNK